MEDMPRKLPKYVTKTRTRFNKVLFYFRQDKGPRTRLPNDPDSKAFEEAYAACLGGQPVKAKIEKAPSKSFRWLLDRYKESSAWSSLAPATRRQRDNIFSNILPKIGHIDFAAIQSAQVRNSMEARRDTPAQANNLLKALSGVFEWAARNEHVKVNPTVGVSKLKVKTKGFPLWTDADASAFRETWPIGTMQRLAFELLLHTGLRRSDIVQIGKQHIRGNVLSIRTKKTDVTITVELTQYVLDVIEDTKTGDLHLVVTSHGKPFTDAGFGNWFHECSSKAGVEKNAHGVRKLSATLSANAGATAHELMAQFGWSSSKQAEVYTKGAYGMLWLAVTDNPRVHEARKQLLSLLDKEGQKRGIQVAKNMFGPATTAEIMQLDAPLPTPEASPAPVEQDGSTNAD